jgi:hypothetical protein
LGSPVPASEQHFGDFRRSDGLYWPRQFVEYLDGALEQEIRVRAYKINPRIDMRRFQPIP